MELVSASKMKRSIDGAVVSRPYTKTLKNLAQVIATSVHDTGHDSPNARQVLGEQTLVIVVASNRGLCGAYNTQIGRELARYMRSIGTGNHHSFITIGKKADIIVKRQGGKIEASFHDLPETVTIRSIQPIVRYIEKAFATGHYARVKILYTEFKSALTQEVMMHGLLPVQFEGNGAGPAVSDFVQNIEYVVEPSANRVMQILKSRFLTSLIFQYLQESRASEHSARMMAMRNAKDAADEMVEGLSLEYNKARQAGITREIAEISAGQLSITS